MTRKVAIYARVSTEHEAQLSALDNQVQDYNELLKKHPDWELYDRYIDEGITGTSVKKRKNFMRMLKDAENKCFDLIITREVSRFARNTVDTLQVTRNLKKLGIEVYFVEDNIWTFNDEDGELKLTIMATLAQNESRKTSQRVKAGMKISMLNGVFYGTGNIMGYDRVGKEMVINEEQAKVVKLIYKLFLEGYGTEKIKYELEKRDIPTATGLKNWSVATIGRMLQNPFYAGIIVYKKQITLDYLEQKKVKNKGQVEQIVVDGKHVPLISKEDFEEVQKLIKEHSIYIQESKKAKMQFPPQYIWSKKLKCECGSNLNRRQFSNRDKEHITYSYQCYRQKNEGSGIKRKKLGLTTEGYCDNPQVPEWKLEVMGSVLFSKVLSDKDIILDMANGVLDEAITSVEENGEIIEEINLYKTKIEKNKAKNKKLLKGYLDGIVGEEEYQEVKEEINKENDNLEKEIKSLESKANYKNIDFKDMIKQLKKKLSKKIDYNSELTEELLDLYVSKIIVHKDHFDWKLNYLSDKIESDDEDNYNDIFLTRILITREDIIKFNEKKHCLKKVMQKDPIIMDIYI